MSGHGGPDVPGGPGGPRLLPWTRPDGAPCYLIGDGTGYVSRLADRIERTQLDMALDLLGHTVDILADRHVTSAQLRFLVGRLAESLSDVLRIAESRGTVIAERDTQHTVDSADADADPDPDPDPDRDPEADPGAPATLAP